MPSRREFVFGATVALTLVPIAACGSNSSDSSTASCSGLSSTSSVAAGHIHTVCVPETDLTSPPPGGAIYTTSGPEPTHTISPTAAQLTAINGGQPVTLTTSTNGGHDHQFVLSKA